MYICKNNYIAYHCVIAAFQLCARLFAQCCRWQADRFFFLFFLFFNFFLSLFFIFIYILFSYIIQFNDSISKGIESADLVCVVSRKKKSARKIDFSVLVFYYFLYIFFFFSLSLCLSLSLSLRVLWTIDELALSSIWYTWH